MTDSIEAMMPRSRSANTIASYCLRVLIPLQLGSVFWLINYPPKSNFGISALLPALCISTAFIIAAMLTNWFTKPAESRRRSKTFDTFLSIAWLLSAGFVWVLAHIA